MLSPWICEPVLVLPDPAHEQFTQDDVRGHEDDPDESHVANGRVISKQEDVGGDLK